MYPRIIIEHFMKPKNVGSIKNATAVGEAGAVGGGKVIIYLLIKGDTIVDFKYQVDGCPYAIASASIMSEKLKGTKVNEVGYIGIDFFSNFFDVPEDKKDCVEIVVNAFNKAIEKFRGI